MGLPVVTRCMDCGSDWECPDGLPGTYVCPACLLDDDFDPDDMDQA